LSNIESLIKCLEPLKTKLNEPMSAHTTLGVGGAAEIFYETETSADLVKAVRLSRSFNVPLTIIGNGSGVLVSDKGISGLVIKNSSERIQIKPLKNILDYFRKREIKKAEVIIDSGVSMDFALGKLYTLGLVGLEKYSLIAGSIGAMVSKGECKDLLRKISFIDEHGGVKSVGLDKRQEGSIVTDATFLLSYGKIDEKPKRKSRSGKSIKNVFENLLEDEQQALGYPTNDPGYIIGEILNMKGFKKGKMTIPADSCNEIENLGGGTALDCLNLIEEIKSRARESISIELVEKVVRLGF